MQIVVHSATHNNDVGLSQELKKYLSNSSRNNVLIDQVKYKKLKVNRSIQKGDVV